MVRTISRKFRLFLFQTIIAAAMSAAVCGDGAAATLPNGFSETLIANGLSSPTAMDFAPDGRLFVCLQAGQE